LAEKEKNCAWPQKSPARNSTAQPASAYCCFLPDLAGLGGACSHGSWQDSLQDSAMREELQAFRRRDGGCRAGFAGLLFGLLTISPLADMLVSAPETPDKFKRTSSNCFGCREHG